MVDSDYDASRYDIVSGVTITIDLTSATAMNLLPIELYAVTQTLEYESHYALPNYVHKTFNWHLCVECAEYLAHFMPEMIKRFAPEHYIMQDTTTRLYSKFIEQLNDTIITGTLDHDVCSYGNCHAELLAKFEFKTLAEEYRDQRLDMIRMLSESYIDYVNRIRKLKRLVFTEEHILNYSTNSINNLFLEF